MFEGIYSMSVLPTFKKLFEHACSDFQAIFVSVQNNDVACPASIVKKIYRKIMDTNPTLFSETLWSYTSTIEHLEKRIFA